MRQPTSASPLIPRKVLRGSFPLPPHCRSVGFPQCLLDFPDSGVAQSTARPSPLPTACGRCRLRPCRLRLGVQPLASPCALCLLRVGGASGCLGLHPLALPSGSQPLRPRLWTSTALRPARRFVVAWRFRLGCPHPPAPRPPGRGVSPSPRPPPPQGGGGGPRRADALLGGMIDASVLVQLSLNSRIGCAYTPAYAPAGAPAPAYLFYGSAPLPTPEIAPEGLKMPPEG